MEDNLIQGDPSLCNRKASWKATMKTLNNDGLGFFVQDVKQDCRGQAREVEFEDVFKMPPGLPTIRDHDHAILLKPEAEIQNLRPYRYYTLFYQKNEIERTVKDMMQAVIVRHNTCPFFF